MKELKKSQWKKKKKSQRVNLISGSTKFTHRFVVVVFCIYPLLRKPFSIPNILKVLVVDFFKNAFEHLLN